MDISRVFTFRNCVVRADFGLGYTETIFRDGSIVPAYPMGTREQRDTCATLGYGADVAGMCREHEILHTWLCEQFGLPHSPTLWAVAHGQSEGSAPIWAQQNEEALVLSFQAFLNGADYDRKPLKSLARNGMSMHDLKQRALTILRAA